ncbi:MAG: hypothetical protein GY845_18435 [Planctomycetes bacterium]|nr:hypothetical protein [Planctomycetota bacterium]
MIITDKVEEFSDIWRLVMYDTNKEGRCVPQYTMTELQDEINTYYVQQVEKLSNLHKRLLASEISPIYFFMEYYRLDVKGLAARMKLSPSTVKKHLTFKGFSGVKVETLQRYAKIFDVAVCDFFQFTYVPDDVSFEVKRYNNRLIQHVTISKKS